MVPGKEGVAYFSGDWSFYIKRFIKKIFLSFITKNLNWEILTKNLVTFKRWDGVKDEKF